MRLFHRFGVGQDEVGRAVQQRFFAFGIGIRAIFGVGDEKDMVDLARTQQPPVAFVAFGDVQDVIDLALDLGEGLGRRAVEGLVEDGDPVTERADLFGDAD